jgi:uncharacterized protein
LFLFFKKNVMTNDSPRKDEQKPSFWNSAIGTITKITAFLAAITGFILAVKPFLNAEKGTESTIAPKTEGVNEVRTNNGKTDVADPANKPDYTSTKYVPTASDISAFLTAAKEGNVEALKAKLDLGIEADINLTGDPTTALINAVDNNKPEAAKILLEHRANPNAKVRGISYPIIEASFWGYTEIVSLLIQHKADLNIRKQDGSGITSLMFACINGHKDVVQKLIDSGAEVDISAINNSTALDFANASSSGSKGQIIAILNSVGAHSGQ